MKLRRTLAEIKELHRHDEWRVSYDLEEREVIVHGVRLSEAWEPERIDVLLELPVHYPRHRPRVYVDESLRFVGDGETGHRRPVELAPQSRDDSVEWCPMYLGMGWEQEYTLLTVVSMIERVTRS